MVPLWWMCKIALLMAHASTLKTCLCPPLQITGTPPMFSGAAFAPVQVEGRLGGLAKQTAVLIQFCTVLKHLPEVQGSGSSVQGCSLQGEPRLFNKGSYLPCRDLGRLKQVG